MREYLLWLFRGPHLVHTSTSLRPSDIGAQSEVSLTPIYVTVVPIPCHLAHGCARYHAHLTRTLAKWSAKVAAVAPSALLPASRKRFSQAGSAMAGVKSVGTQIEEMLRNDWPALLSRTRLRRNKGPYVTGEQDSTEVGGEDVEVFDDTDFYQQLLRDVIDTKGGDAAQVEWMASQRKRKSQKKVDTKASKGRKIRFVSIFLSLTFASKGILYRYQVHEKIQNFMVPVPLPAGAWHETQIDELFASLLGKGFDNLEGDVGDIQHSGLSADALALSGFKIFG
jgi:protein AATF/BFR2